MIINGLENLKTNNNINNNFFDFINCYSNINVSLCYSPIDLICNDSCIYSKSNGFELKKDNNKLLFNFDDINSLNSFYLLIKTNGLEITTSNDFKTIEFVDKNNLIIHKLPVLFFIDSNSKLFLDCKYKIIKRNDGDFLIGFKINEECLNKGVLFPITIDPQVSISSSNISMQGLIFDSNTNYVENFSSCMVGCSQHYLFGTRIKIKLKDYINANKINIDDINTCSLKIRVTDSSIRCIYVTDETNNSSTKVYKNSNIYEIDIKKYINKTLNDISLLLNYYDNEMYEEISFIDLNMDYKENIISSIYIKNPPNKTKYEYGDSFDPSGLIVVAVYTNGDEKEITDYEISKGILNRNTKKIIISYKGVECYQEIEVYSKPVSLVLTTDSRFKSTYIYYETPSLFGVTGKVKFEDGTIETTSNLKLDSSAPLINLGDAKLKITYTDSHYNITVSNSIDIKVNAFDSIYRGKSIDENGLNLYDLSLHQTFPLASSPNLEYFSVSLIYDSLLPRYLKKINDILPCNCFLSCCLFLYKENDKTFKFIDKDGFTHSFDYIENSNVLYDNENTGLILYIEENCIKDRKDTCIYFTSDGRADYILYGKYSYKRIDYIYDENKKIKKICDSTNSQTYLSFTYDSENYLIQIDAYFNNEKVDCSALNYKKIRIIYLEKRKEAYLSSIEKVNVYDETKIKTLDVIYQTIGTLNLKLIGFNYLSTHFAIRLENNYYSNLNHDCISKMIVGRLDESNDFILEDEYEISYTGFTLDDFRHICEVIITDINKNTKKSYMISKFGEIVSNLGCKRYGVYFTLAPEYGYKLKLDGYGESINNRKASDFKDSITLDKFEEESVSDIENRCLSIWVKLSKKCNIAYLCSKNDKSIIEINSDVVDSWQVVNIPLRETNLPIDLFIKDEKNNIIKAKYADPIITNQKESKTQLVSIHECKFLGFKNSKIIIDGKNYYNGFTILDFIATFIEYGFYSRKDIDGNYLDSPAIYLYGNKKKLKFNDEIILIDETSKQYKLVDLIKNNQIIINKYFSIENYLYVISLNFEDDLLKIITQVTRYDINNIKYTTIDIKYYDCYGLLIKEQDEKGVVTYYDYDNNFKLLKCYRKNGDNEFILNENTYNEYGILENQKNNIFQIKYNFEKGLLKEENYFGLNSTNDVLFKSTYQYDGYSRINKYTKNSINKDLNCNAIYSGFDLNELNDETDKINLVYDYKSNISKLMINNQLIKEVEYKPDRIINHYPNTDKSFSIIYDNYGKLEKIAVDSTDYVSFEYENNECDKSGVNLSKIIDDFSSQTTECFYTQSGALDKKIVYENNEEIYKISVSSNMTSFKYFDIHNYVISTRELNNSMFTYYFKDQKSSRNLIFEIDEKYDSLNRLINIRQIIATDFDCEYNYYNNSLLFKRVLYQKFKSNFQVEYDSLGRIRKTNNVINNNNYVDEIEYDEIGRLKSFKRNGDSPSNIFQHIYSYDGSKLSCIYNPINYETRNFYYNTNGLLTRIKNNRDELLVSYDKCLNITSFDDGRKFKYDVGNRLIEANVDGSIVKFKYDYRGIRTSKESSSLGKIRYFYEDNMLIGMTANDKCIHFVYSQNKVLGFIVESNNCEYMFSYLKNQHGDIIGIIKDGNNLVATYEYDEYGNVLKEQILDKNYEEYIRLNPFRYRGYVYDEETRLYYLLTRYYDPKAIVFLTPDDEDNYDIKNISPYGYCLYDPINKIDPYGCFSLPAFIFSVVAGTLISGGLTFINEMRKNDWDIKNVDWKNVGISALIGGVCGGLSQLDAFESIWWGAFFNGVGSVISEACDTGLHWSLLFTFVKGFAFSLVSIGVTRFVGKCITIKGMKTINQNKNLFSKYNIVTLVYKLQGYEESSFPLMVPFVYKGQNWIWNESKIGEVFNDILSGLLGWI